MVKKKPLYTYKGIVISVYDGDTIGVRIDVGFAITVEQQVRLYGIDAPELRNNFHGKGRKEAAILSRDFLKSLLLDKEIILETIKVSDKYGRFLAEIWVDNGVGDTISVNALMIEKGLATSYTI